MIYTYVATALVSAALAFGGAWKLQSLRMDAKDKERLEAQQELDRNNRAAAQAASEGFENDRTEQTEKFRTIRVEVEKIVTRDVYRNQCFESDGMRALSDAIGTTTDTRKPEGPLPTASSPG